MKFQAHPLVVAAALGLIGPGALAEEDEADSGELCLGCPPADPPDGKSEVASPALAVEPIGDEWTWTPGEAPDPEAFHRVELAWLKESQGR